MSLRKNEIIELEINSLSNDGNGIGRYNGQAVFVPVSAIGDLLKVRIVKPMKNYAYGRIEQIIRPGGNRIESDCPASKQCGGCSFRHITYECELAAKQGFVKSAIERIAKLNIEVQAIKASPLLNRYRNKSQYPVQQNNAGEAVYGFYAKNSHRIVNSVDCLLQPEIVNQIAKKTAALLNKYQIEAYDENCLSGSIRHIYIRYSQVFEEIMLCLVSASGNISGLDELCFEISREFPQIKSIILNINNENTNVICGNSSTVLYGKAYINDVLLNVPIKLGPHSFNQVNSKAAEILLGTVKEFASVTHNENLLDLYCGAGVIGLSMAENCKTLTGIDITAEAIESAKKAAFEMNLHNTSFICGDAGAAADKLLQNAYKPDVLIVDPPRKGCSPEALNTILKLSPNRIVMVSCNPATMARDMAFLSSNGYNPEKIQAIDMFPRTTHVEAVVLMLQKG